MYCAISTLGNSDKYPRISCGCIRLRRTRTIRSRVWRGIARSEHLLNDGVFLLPRGVQGEFAELKGQTPVLLALLGPVHEEGAVEGQEKLVADVIDAVFKGGKLDRVLPNRSGGKPLLPFLQRRSGRTTMPCSSSMIVKCSGICSTAQNHALRLPIQ